MTPKVEMRRDILERSGVVDNTKGNAAMADNQMTSCNVVLPQGCKSTLCFVSEGCGCWFVENSDIRWLERIFWSMPAAGNPRSLLATLFDSLIPYSDAFGSVRLPVWITSCWKCSALLLLQYLIVFTVAAWKFQFQWWFFMTRAIDKKKEVCWCCHCIPIPLTIGSSLW